MALLALVADAALLYLLKVNFSRVWVLTSWVAIIAAVPLVRAAAKQLSARLGAWRQPTVVIGTGRNALEAALAFACDNHIGFPTIWATRSSPSSTRRVVPTARPGWRSPAAACRSSRSTAMRRACPAGSAGPTSSWRWSSTRWRAAKASSRTCPALWRHRRHHPLRGLPINRAKVTHFFSQDFVSFRIYNNLARPWSQAVKRGFDLFIGAVLLRARPR